MTYAQTQTTAPAEKKDTPAQTISTDQGKSGECAGHQTTGAKMECKWVDANSDGKCDTCGKTEKGYKEACQPAAGASAKSGCAATCPHANDCGKSTGTTPPKKD